MNRIRIYMTGVGGQGTLTATTLLAKIALHNNVLVTAGEIHGMAQRGGVVESFVLLGGWQSPKLSYGEADIFLGFEPLETLRGLPYLKQDGALFTSTNAIASPGMSAGKEQGPSLEHVQSEIAKRTSRAWYIPCRELGLECGSIQSGNTALLGALAASDLLPFGFDALIQGIEAFLPPKVVAANITAAKLGKEAVAK